MQRYRLPNTHLDVSALCFGTGSLGTSVKDGDADRLVAAFLEAGGNFLDTAHCYAFWKPGGLGASERELGASLRRLGALDRAVIATKGGHPDQGEAYRRPADFLASPVIARDIDESLERLGVETIDLYYLHRDDGQTPVAEIIETLNGEVRRGRLRYLGASNWTVPRLAAANEYAARRGLRGFVASQVQWSLAEPNWRMGPDPSMRHVTEEETTWHATSGLPLIVYSATANGYFADPERAAGSFDNPVNRERLQRARELAARRGCTPTQIALAYLMCQPSLVIPIFATTNPDHLHEILSAVEVRLSLEEVRWLEGEPA
jgi:aryl-alcohol dehydrogenase-like predicted oxidoreductase